MIDIPALLRRKDNLAAASAALAAGEAEIKKTRRRLQADCPHPGEHKAYHDEHTEGGLLHRAETVRYWRCGICDTALGCKIIHVGGFE